MIKSITSVKVQGRRVIVRVGFDVPLKKNIHTEEWEAADDTRIKDALRTIEYLIQNQAKVTLISHLGRPEGRQADKSLWPAAKRLGEFLGMKVVKISSELPHYPIPHIYFLTEDITKHDYSKLPIPNGSILFLENLRFYAGEEENDPEFIQTLAKFGELYVNEAFSVSHRVSASTYGLAVKLKSYCGIAFEREIKALYRLLRNPTKPMVILIGGLKISDKVESMRNLLKGASHILLGGAIANTFLKAKGYEIGKSKFADESLAKELTRNFKEKIILPVDVVVAHSLEDTPHNAAVSKVMPEDIILDIGPETIRKFSEYVKNAVTLVWNGPFGMIEIKRYAFGSESMARVFAGRSKGPAYGVAGGGETLEVLNSAKVTQFVDHVSTGGGAMLEFLSGKKLPAIKVLEANHA
ncbi:MAG: phosphoglycerate kinase [Candidatus Doudnabacteria bacterium RIFCSPLOWO2_02_FULL_48_8]|uniref:Phosphoglycerate kinase n=1 Tax=Candidatus Doudnabacteria bacterium RIFCSPHIGHO2_01_FULL_46_24 TaxID=1817825 RepID=A0A1F5NUZ6_9BACT|nr:MAG: phosphoglycerate kinase [Candidatus Doudnabacteria bacterium RIFCSPHIGHO2_01_FULL_46_24]OGE95013.1 MAG: phosphoglycerate kinase [Candidatus Doudnabacteria bacterium RIFCSPLOWO2_02_FULL_48_8]OGE95948.1 MAG: phosphoglycerate kinase [Candidatus Doudnabacteria bacterium RIFCSPHIGHO2_12_FULL_48_11]